MAHRFARSRAGLTARLDDAEREVLHRLMTDVAGMLDQARPVAADPLEELVGITEGAVLPDDPALARLLPDASRDDDEVAAEFRRLTERGLRHRKHDALTTATATLERTTGSTDLVLTEEEAAAWLTALNDVRLVLAERLGVRTDEDAERVALRAVRLPADDPVAWLSSVYDFLTWLQESLVQALSSAPRR